MVILVLGYLGVDRVSFEKLLGCTFLFFNGTMHVFLMETESSAVQHKITNQMPILDGIEGRLLHPKKRDEHIGFVVADALGKFLDKPDRRRRGKNFYIRIHGIILFLPSDYCV